jgi:tRNA A-37 threonylcarbamoyl transferase component Bud32
MRQKIYARRSRRCLKTNREFEMAKHNGRRWNVRLPFLNSGLKCLLDDPEGWRVSAVEKLKCGRSSTVIAYKELVLKSFHHRRWPQRMAEMFFSSRGRRAYQKAYHLELLGIPTPRPVATATCRSIRFLSRSYLVTERVKQGREVGQYLREVQQPQPVVIRNVAEMIARLHNEGFSHSDLKERNILLDADQKCWLLDLDSLRFMRCVSDARAAADLKRLSRAVSLDPQTARGVTFLFLRHYFRIRGRRPWPRKQRRIRSNEQRP